MSRVILSSTLVEQVIDSFSKEYGVGKLNFLEEVFYLSLTEELSQHLSSELGVKLSASDIFLLEPDDFLNSLMTKIGQVQPIGN